MVVERMEWYGCIVICTKKIVSQAASSLSVIIVMLDTILEQRALVSNGDFLTASCEHIMHILNFDHCPSGDFMTLCFFPFLF